MRVAFAIALLGLLPLAPLAAAEAAKIVILPMEVKAQERNIWCWAAVTEMVEAHFLAEEFRQKQCEIVNREVEFSDPDWEGDCCKDIDRLCDQLGIPDLEDVGYEWQVGLWPRECGVYDGVWKNCPQKDEWWQTESALTWKQFKKQIDNNRPVVAGWVLPGASNIHIVVASGYISQPRRTLLKSMPGEDDPEFGYEGVDSRWVVINDPSPPHIGSSYLVPFDVFARGYEGHLWDMVKVGKKAQE